MEIIIKETENNMWGVYLENNATPIKVFDDFEQADMFKEKYVVENNLPVTSIENDLLCNIKITIPHCIKLEKFSTIEIEENTLTLFAAKPGNGKTLFMFDFARECLKKNYKCIFFSLEMSKEAIKKRYKDNDLIFNSDNIILKDRNDITLTNIEMTIKYYIKSKTAFSKPDFIFIDYIQYISTDDFSLKEFARQIKRLAKKYKIRFICAAQLNANFAIEKTNDIVDAMSGSREISKTAEMIILCYKEKNIFNLEVVKNRNGENGPDTHLHFTLNKDGILEPYTDFEKDNKRITRETIIAHELGHNFVQYIICNKVSPIHITNWGGYVLAKKLNADDELKVLYGGVIAEDIFFPEYSPSGHSSDMHKVDRIVHGLYFRENLYIHPSFNDNTDEKKFENFKKKYLAPIVEKVKNILLDNKKGLQRIFDTLNKNSEKNIFTSSELWDLFSQNNWLTKSFE